MNFLSKLELELQEQIRKELGLGLWDTILSLSRTLHYQGQT